MPLQLTKSTLAEFTTKELLDYYNNHSGEEAVKRFSDRASAERRVMTLLDKKSPAPTPAPTVQAGAEGKPVKAKKAKSVKVPKEPKTPKTPKEPKTPKVPKERKTPEQRSAAVKDSWADESVRKARSARYNVRVDGTLYESVMKAFQALKLDTKPHQRVRRELVANGKVEHEGRKFVLSPKED